MGWHHAGELLALDLQAFTDWHVQSASNSGDDAADNQSGGGYAVGYAGRAPVRPSCQIPEFRRSHYLTRVTTAHLRIVLEHLSLTTLGIFAMKFSILGTPESDNLMPSSPSQLPNE